MMIRPPSLSVLARRFNCSLTAILHSAFFLLHSPRGGFVGALWEPCRRIRVALAWLYSLNQLAINKPRGGLGVALGGFDPALAGGQAFLSAGEPDFLVHWIEGCGDWKVARTGRLESLPYVTASNPADA